MNNYAKTALTLSLLFFGCGSQPDPQEFLYSLEGTRFATSKFRSFDAEGWNIPSGVKTYLFSSEDLTIEHNNYSEALMAPCYGEVVYNFTRYDFEDFVKILETGKVLESEEEDPGREYDVFEKYRDDVDSGAGAEQSEEEKVAVQRSYYVGQIDSDKIDSNCGLSYERDYYFQVSFYRDGDMEFYDHNRKILFFARPL